MDLNDKMKIIQVKLTHGTTVMITWIDWDQDIKKGSRISLRGNKDKIYIVDEVYGTNDSKNLHTDWNVGGLNKKIY